MEPLTRIKASLAWVSSLALATALVSSISIAVSAPTTGGNDVVQVKTTHGGDDAWFASAGTWTAVPGAALSMTVPSGQQALFVVRFSGYATCWNDEDLLVVPCEIKVRMQGPSGTSTMNPSKGLLDKNDSDPNAFAIDRSYGPVGPGSYTFTVLVRNPGANPTTGVAYWHLTLERVAT